MYSHGKQTIHFVQHISNNKLAERQGSRHGSRELRVSAYCHQIRASKKATTTTATTATAEKSPPHGTAQHSMNPLAVSVCECANQFAVTVSVCACVCVSVCVRAASRHLCQGLDLASRNNNKNNASNCRQVGIKHTHARTGTHTFTADTQQWRKDTQTERHSRILINSMHHSDSDSDSRYC